MLITTLKPFKHKYIENLAYDAEHENDPWLSLLLSLIIGLPLYALKRKHIVPTEQLILGFILAPLALFFIVVAISGVSMQELRDDGWFLTQVRSKCEQRRGTLAAFQNLASSPRKRSNGRPGGLRTGVGRRRLHARLRVHVNGVLAAVDGRVRRHGRRWSVRGRWVGWAGRVGRAAELPGALDHGRVRHHARQHAQAHEF